MSFLELFCLFVVSFSTIELTSQGAFTLDHSIFCSASEKCGFSIPGTPYVGWMQHTAYCSEIHRPEAATLSSDHSGGPSCSNPRWVQPPNHERVLKPIHPNLVISASVRRYSWCEAWIKVLLLQVHRMQLFHQTLAQNFVQDWTNLWRDSEDSVRSHWAGGAKKDNWYHMCSSERRFGRTAALGCGRTSWSFLPKGSSEIGDLFLPSTHMQCRTVSVFKESLLGLWWGQKK